MTERRSYSRHRLNAVMAKAMVRGIGAIDKRTGAAQALWQWRNELLTDLGGEGNVSSQRLTLVEMAVRIRLYVEHAPQFVSCAEEFSTILLLWGARVPNTAGTEYP